MRCRQLWTTCEQFRDPGRSRETTRAAPAGCFASRGDARKHGIFFARRPRRVGNRLKYIRFSSRRRPVRSRPTTNEFTKRQITVPNFSVLRRRPFLVHKVVHNPLGKSSSGGRGRCRKRSTSGSYFPRRDGASRGVLLTPCPQMAIRYESASCTKQATHASTILSIWEEI